MHTALKKDREREIEGSPQVQLIDKSYEDARKSRFEHLQNVTINSKSGPFSDDNGELRQSDGGLASGVHPVANQTDATWVHIGGEGDERHLSEEGALEIPADYEAAPNFFNPELEDEFYYDVSNRELWPLMHDMAEKSHGADEESWNSYRRVNWEFAQEINERTDAGAPIWIHDYQNMLVSEMVRAGNEESPIIYTHHIPIPEIDSFQQISHDKEILEGLASTDAIGVHTDGDRERLLDIAEAYGAEVNRRDSTFEVEGYGRTKVSDIPLGIDNERYTEVETYEIERRMDIADELGADYESWVGTDDNGDIKYTRYEDDLNLIFAPARADYTKGLDRLIDAYEMFQKRNPDGARKTRLVLKPMPTRGSIDEYAELWEDLEIRGKTNMGIDLRTDWMKHDEMVELYRAADVIAAPSYNDGLNLVAKEGVTANANGDYRGTLMLGGGAGAAEAFGDDAMLVDPSDPEEMSYMLEEAFDMPYSERDARMASMNQNVETYDAEWWTQEYDVLAGEAKRLRAETL